ncbi:MAG: hypothetical protein MI919_23545, partial [Holophagales bacterium]|nr:hypothetical protein [Holophagales bacterium]
GVLSSAPIQSDFEPRLTTSIALDPGDLVLYAIDSAGRAWGKRLFVLWPLTGQVIDIGDLWGDQTEASSIAFNPSGNKLYGINNADNVGAGDVLFEIDLETAETKDIGPLTGSRTRAVTLRFAPDGTLYGTRRNNDDGVGSVLFLIDPDDATTRDVGFFHGDHTHATSMAIRRQ